MLGLVGLLVAGYLALIRAWPSLILLVVTLIGGSILSDALKLLFERPRPDLVAHLVEVQSMSFPSGHATYAALAYLTFGALLVRTQPRTILKFYVMATAVLLTLLVGVSRVFLGVHYPSDVLAGWCLGSAWAMACWFIADIPSRRLHRDGREDDEWREGDRDDRAAPHAQARGDNHPGDTPVRW